MAHCLFARDGQRYLSPRVVVTRLKSEFGYVEASEDDGRRHVRGIIQQFQVIKQIGDIAVDNAHLERLKKVQDGAIYVYFGDDPGSETGYLGMAVIPGEPLFFDYSSPAHERAAHTLLLRCAEALGYDIVEI